MLVTRSGLSLLDVVLNLEYSVFTLDLLWAQENVKLLEIPQEGLGTAANC